MPHDDVADLVRHYSGYLRLIICGIDRAAVDVNKTAWQRERVDRGIIHDLELVRIFFARRVRGQLLSERINVGGRLTVVKYLQLTFRLLRRLSSHLDVLLRREEIPARLQFGAAVGSVRGEDDR